MYAPFFLLADKEKQYYLFNIHYLRRARYLCFKLCINIIYRVCEVKVAESLLTESRDSSIFWQSYSWCSIASQENSTDKTKKKKKFDES